MAHVLQGWLLACGRDPRVAAGARRRRSRGPPRCPANERERAAPRGARRRASTTTTSSPRPARGAAAGSSARPAGPARRPLLRLHCRRHRPACATAWPPAAAHGSSDLPGFHALLAMHAFAPRGMRRAMPGPSAPPMPPWHGPARRPRPPRAGACLRDDRAAPSGLRWMTAQPRDLERRHVVATHCWWHLSLYPSGQPGDGSCRSSSTTSACAPAPRSRSPTGSMPRHCCGACSSRAATPGRDGAELAAAWAPHTEDRFCSFYDLHAMLAFVGAQEWDCAKRLERSLTSSQTHRDAPWPRRRASSACRPAVRSSPSVAATTAGGLPAREPCRRRRAGWAAATRNATCFS